MADQFIKHQILYRGEAGRKYSESTLRTEGSVNVVVVVVRSK